MVQSQLGSHLRCIKVGMHLAYRLCTAIAERTQAACCANSLQTLVRDVLDHLHDVYRHREYRQLGHRGVVETLSFLKRAYLLCLLQRTCSARLMPHTQFKIEAQK